MNLFDARGNIIQRSINLDPNFFTTGMNQGTISPDAIEANPYAFHGWTHACAWVIARNISQLQMRLIDGETDEQVEDRWGVLKLFQRPNPLMSYTPFIQHIVLALLLRDKANGTGGQCFVVPRSAEGTGKVDLRKGEIPDVLLPFTNANFTPTKTKGTDGLENLLGWEFTIDSTHKIPYLMNELIRIYFVNPDNWLSGMSCYTPARMAILQDIKSDLYNNNLFDNNGTPAGILKTDMLLTREIAQSMLDQWNQTYGGVSNAGKTALLQRGLEYQRIALTNQDMQFAETKKNSFEQILASFGLNKIAVGLYEDINYATIKEGRRILWNDTYKPIATNICEAITSQWIMNVDPRLKLVFDYSQVDALQPDLLPKAEAMGKMVAAGLPPAMAMRINGIPYTEQDLVDYPWLNEKQTMSPNVNTPQLEQSATAGAKAIVKKERELDKARFSDDYIRRVLLPGEKQFTKSMDRFFISQRNRMLDNVDAAIKTKAEQEFTGVDLDEILLDIEKENKALKQVFAPLVKDQLLRSEAALEAELGTLVNWHVTDPMIQLYINNRKDEIDSINTTTMQAAGKKVADAVDVSINKGETVNEASKRIKAAIAEVGEIRRGQSTMIARTEIGIITNESRFEAMNAEGIEYTEWVTANDDLVRHTHVVAGNAGPVKLGKDFPGVNMPYPLYSQGDPGEIINCRCVAIAVEG